MFRKSQREAAFQWLPPSTPFWSPFSVWAGFGSHSGTAWIWGQHTYIDICNSKISPERAREEKEGTDLSLQRQVVAAGTAAWTQLPNATTEGLFHTAAGPWSPGVRGSHQETPATSHMFQDPGNPEAAEASSPCSFFLHTAQNQLEPEGLEDFTFNSSSCASNYLCKRARLSALSRGTSFHSGQQFILRLIAGLAKGLRLK